MADTGLRSDGPPAAAPDAIDAAATPGSHPSAAAASRRRSKRTRTIVAAAVIVAALAWVAVSALRSNLVYYKTPTELLNLGSNGVGQQIRLGGVVEPGSLCARGNALWFILTDLRSSVTVATSRGVPQLFAEGRGVIAEGAYGRDRVFHASDVLVKHNDSYSPPVSGPIPHAATPACG